MPEGGETSDEATFGNSVCRSGCDDYRDRCGIRFAVEGLCRRQTRDRKRCRRAISRHNGRSGLRPPGMRHDPNGRRTPVRDRRQTDKIRQHDRPPDSACRLPHHMRLHDDKAAAARAGTGRACRRRVPLRCRRAIFIPAQRLGDRSLRAGSIGNAARRGRSRIIIWIYVFFSYLCG